MNVVNEAIVECDPKSIPLGLSAESSDDGPEVLTTTCTQDNLGNLEDLLQNPHHTQSYDADKDTIFHEWGHLPLHLDLLSSNDDASHKRDFQTAFSVNNNTQELPAWIGQPSIFPDFLPAVPLPANRITQAGIANPFGEEQGAAVVHPALRNPVALTYYKPKKSTNAFIKIRWFEKKGKNHGKRLPSLLQQRPDIAKTAMDTKSSPDGPVSRLPPNFGDVGKLDNLDRSFYRFFILGICAGRTVINTDNAYKTEIAPMVERSDLVRHALLALSTTYLLDFNRADHAIKAKAEYHHKNAVDKLGEELSNMDIQSPGKEEAVCAAISLLVHNEVVNWEVDRSGEDLPKWYLAGQVGERVLSQSDPGYRYSFPFNVQCNRARTQLTHIIGLENILSDCVYPLDPTLTRCSYPWLLEGSETEQRKIVGTTGLCSKLLHYYAKITHLSSKSAKNPKSEVYPRVGKELEKRLQRFWQWSDLSEGYGSSQDLLDSCELDENGTVTSATKVTELVGESYVTAAQIYLQCRFFRRSQRHPTVQKILQTLLRTIDWQPTSGPLFTAQTPMFAVFIAGIVAYKEADRAVVRKWFEPICGDSRGNVPPAWRAMQVVWKWADEIDAASEVDSGADREQAKLPLGERHAWWEELSNVLKSKEGRMSLS
ncbi:uncharacterized protein KY384_003367 [Bacidia gigantensis]|uniref:uncharacterized protein n=1 Tax=Bacidia gigantensis TaxID=2732470 RepID=UPI001D044F2F|nr:uncharacterized protein KY384_003367 [Bacidia gigantensis]KAG8531735.1 hypothetical protein KY384_003367 [Bacidia gigantensis]